MMAEGEHEPDLSVTDLAPPTVAAEVKSSSLNVLNGMSIASPPGSQTPPSHPTKKTLYFNDSTSGRSQSRPGSEPVDPDALARALKDYDEAGRRRERTPGASPSRKRQRVYGDRYVYKPTSIIHLSDLFLQTLSCSLQLSKPL
jgi:hypothetical protein